MKILAFVGNSESGKTRLIAHLLPELKKRGLSVAVVKHCSHGFDFGGPEKDSSKFLESGADGVALAAQGRTAVIDNLDFTANLGALAQERFAAVDLVLVEGGRSDPRLRKIEVLRRGFSDRIQTPVHELEAVVADFPVEGEVPIFHPDAVQEIADWLARIWVRNNHVQGE